MSGYLITTILITTGDGRGDLDLRHFWLPRARRLLPALIMVLIVVLVATPVLDDDVLLLAAPGFDNSRAYQGTDAGAGGLLMGAALAMVWPPTQLAL